MCFWWSKTFFYESRPIRQLREVSSDFNEHIKSPKLTTVEIQQGTVDKIFRNILKSGLKCL